MRNGLFFQEVPCETIQTEGEILGPNITILLLVCFSLLSFFIIAEELVFTCEKRCSKKRSCGRHKCGELCCVVSII